MAGVEVQEKTEVVPERVRSFLGKVPGNALAGLTAADGAWSRLRSDAFTTPPPTPPVKERKGERYLSGGARAEYDVVVVGGTLGIFLAAALAVRGFKVAVVEQGVLVGRTQEWNISRRELVALVETGVLTEAELDAIIVSDFSPQRVGFTADGEDYLLDTIKGVLNLGVDPLSLIAKVRASFLAAGGTLLERHAFQEVNVYDDAAVVSTTIKGSGDKARGAGGDGAFDTETAAEGSKVEVVGRLMVDAMGNFSPVMRQARGYQKPQGVCVVVGSCARAGGTDWVDNSFGDLIYSFTPIKDDRQYFWEAFPSQDLHGSKKESRTSYMFAYLDADPRRPSLFEIFDDYLELLPGYSGVRGKTGAVPDVANIEASRALFGIFPSYTDSPLPVKFDRILQAGDSSGLQSPLSFGGFGSLLRHLERTSTGIAEALDLDLAKKQDLAILQPYLPSLSVMWLFQNAMYVPVGKSVTDPEIINKVLKSNFKTMEKLGSGVMMPFLQDVIQASGLFATIAGMSVFDPLLVPPLLVWVGPVPVVIWGYHFALLLAYSAAYQVTKAVLPLVEEQLDPMEKFQWRRRVEAFKYGSGGDY